MEKDFQVLNGYILVIEYILMTKLVGILRRSGCEDFFCDDFKCVRYPFKKYTRSNTFFIEEYLRKLKRKLFKKNGICR